MVVEANSSRWNRSLHDDTRQIVFALNFLENSEGVVGWNSLKTRKRKSGKS